MNLDQMRDFANELCLYFKQEKIVIEDTTTEESSLIKRVNPGGKVNLNKKVKLNKKVAVRFTISMGLVEYSGREFKGFHEMCKTADDYMMLAKKQGKNQVVTSGSEI